MNTDFDTALYKALTVYNRALVKSFPEEKESAADFSPRHQRRMEKLFKRCDRFYYPAVRTKARRALALAATVTLVLALPFSVSATRIEFAQFVTKVYTVCTDLFFPSSAPSAPFVPTEPSYIPAGFKEVSRETDAFSNYITYRNNEGKEILFYQFANFGSHTSTINTENAQVKKIILKNEVEALYAYNDDFALIYFSSSNSNFEINGLISEEEFVKVAESTIN